MKCIHLWGVKQNNLKNLDVKIPLGSFTVLCGPSGSGKSSLAFETLYAEGQRRYIESLSNYARQFLNKAPKPDIEGIENIPPAIAIEQKNYVKTSRSTVGTHTEIIDYLRLLFEKIGEPYCPNCHIPIERSFVTDSTDKVLKKFSGKRGYVLAPITEKSRIATGKKLLELLVKDGYLRIFHKKEVIDIHSKTLPKSDFHVVIDRMGFDEGDRGRLADSLAQAYATSMNLNADFTGGKALVRTVEGDEIRVSEENECSKCGYTMPPITSQLFNFSNPIGACPTCNGFGNLLKIDENKVIPDPTKSIQQGAIEPFTMPSAKDDRKELIQYCKRAKISVNTPWNELSDKHRKIIWDGNKDFFGVEGLFKYLETKKYKMHVRVFLARYKSPFMCMTCKGTRLRPEAEAILIKGNSITKLSQLTIERLELLLKEIQLTSTQKKISEEVLNQLLARLQFLSEVGVEYLTVDRPTRTLSGGEYQRIQLANQLGMVLSQTLYVLDEPTVGLHPRDNDRLISILKKLNNLGNTLVVVEHDADVIRNSDNVIELGPGSGHLGGEIIYSGLTKDFYNFQNSNTALYLSPDKKIISNTTNRPVDMDQFRYAIDLRGAKGNNLKNVNVKIPLRRLIAITGVSGSGKSTLISQTLYPAIARTLGVEFGPVQPYKSIEGIDNLKNVVYIDQRPISRSARSNPVTYLKAFTEIRDLMASVEEAKINNYGPGFFSLNVDGGRCPVCKGEGFETIDMLFMDDVKLICDACDGKRFQKEILEVRFKGKNIDDILNMTVSEAMAFFVSSPQIRQPLHILREVGLDYIRLGQPTATLSGGESQRLKIAKELSMSDMRETLYILDEPTTGLHFREVELLMGILNKLIDGGGTVIVIEHNLEVIRACDYVIDLGPEGGEKGGQILFAGTPEELSHFEESYTGQYLKPIFSGAAKKETRTLKRIPPQVEGDR